MRQILEFYELTEPFFNFWLAKVSRVGAVDILLSIVFYLCCIFVKAELDLILLIISHFPHLEFKPKQELTKEAAFFPKFIKCHF